MLNSKISTFSQETIHPETELAQITDMPTFMKGVNKSSNAAGAKKALGLGDAASLNSSDIKKLINSEITTFVKSGTGAKGGTVPTPGTTAGNTKYLCEDGTWKVPPDTNTTYGNMAGATANAAGKAGLVPAPAKGKQATFLRGDGTWATPPDTNTTYSNFVKSGSTASAGLVPKPSTTAGTTKYLCEDGNWKVPSQILATGKNSNWIKGRDGASLKQTAYVDDAYLPMISMKTKEGSWEAGPYKDESLNFAYASDANYNANNNKAKVIKLNSDGSITAANFNGNADSATKAIQDKNGKDIADTYLPLSGGKMTGALTMNKEQFAIGSTPEKNLYPGSYIVVDKNGKNLSTFSDMVTKSGINKVTIKAFENTAGNTTEYASFELIAEPGYHYGTIGTPKTDDDSNKIATTAYVRNAVMEGATSSAKGKSGVVPVPEKGEQNSFLRGDGKWAVPPDTNTTYSDFGKSGSTAKAGLVPKPSTTAGTTKYLCEDGLWKTPPGTTDDMTGATASKAGTHGLVPAPAKGKQDSFLCGDGTWKVPPDTNTTYKDMTGATASKAGTHGLVPAPAKGAQGSLLSGAGTWVAPSTLTVKSSTTATRVSAARSDSWVSGATADGAMVSSKTTAMGAIWNAPTKNYRVACGTHPGGNEDLIRWYSVTNADITAKTNKTTKVMTWNASNGYLTTDRFVGYLQGNCSGNAATATTAKSATTATTATTATKATKALNIPTKDEGGNIWIA